MSSSEPPAKRAKMAIQLRGYQKDVLARALKENIIVYLGTGTGKTLIAITLIESFEQRLSMPHEKRIAVFLVPTVHLVVQQARAISCYTQLTVGEYYGDKGVDTWSIKQWQAEVDQHQVLVMTAQVFLNALGTSALKLDFVEVLVMDECHHAHKNHPYALIMKKHYHFSQAKSKPKIFGMTASPVIKQGVSSSSDCVRKLTALESLLDAKVYTVEDKSEVNEHSPSPMQCLEYYDRMKQFPVLNNQLAQLRANVAEEVGFRCSFNFELERKTIQSIDRLHLTLNHCLSDLGLYPARLAVDVLLEHNKVSQYSKWKPQRPSSGSKISVKEDFLSEASLILNAAQAQAPIACATGEEMDIATSEGKISPKLSLLVNVLMELRKVSNMRCIVFVERVVVSKVLTKVISQLPLLSHVKCDYVTGVGDSDARSPTQQRKVLDDFASGELNVLIATAVAEEGLDVQACCAVIRFDTCQTLRSHIQSRGRARDLHSSSYIWLLERGNAEQEVLFHRLCGSEQIVNREVLFRNNLVISREPPPEDDLEFFRVESGACKSTEDVVSFIHTYCARLGDRYYNAKPKFFFKDTFVCTVVFPPNAPLQSVEGPPRRTEELAKKAACLEACKRLYEMGELRRDTLCPDVDGVDEEDQSMQRTESGNVSELLSSAKPSLFQGSWISSRSSPLVQLQLYKICFSFERPESRKHSNFGLLVRDVIAEEVATEVVTLFSKHRVIEARLNHAGPIQLQGSQLDAAKNYQELLLNAAFCRLENCLDASQEPLWDMTRAFLLLPLSDDESSIDWESVVSTAELYSNFSSLSRTKVDRNASDSDPDMLYTANGRVHTSVLQDAVVLTSHSARLFRVSGLLENMTTASLLPRRNLTYMEYYRDKYGKVLCEPHQPLLKAKQTRGFQNLLASPKKNELQASRERKGFVELPPEICLRLDIKASFLRSLYFVPSFLHRVASIACAVQLRAPHWPWIPASKIVPALTSKKCVEDFSYESLELLGDSFLKYVVTRRLFLVFDKKHEGQLSSRRSRATCNATLYQIAKSAGIAEYVRYDQFNPSSWIGPGMVVTDKLKCRHQSSSSQQDADYYSPCVEGHRGIRRKVLADVVEALIGAYLVDSGPESSEKFMKLLGIEIEFDERLIAASRERSLPLEAFEHLQDSLDSLQRKLQYSFQSKGLLLEAITHASEPNCVLCYQRLEFLGDGVLDYLVSKHLYETDPGLSHGVLTDLRSAAVNNTWFARLVVKHGLHEYLRHGSDELRSEIREFERLVQENPDASYFEDLSAPKALGDLLESIAGAIFVDTNFDLEKLWNVMLPLLSPLVTPATLQFHPVRLVTELCSAKGMTFCFSRSRTGTMLTVTSGEKSLVELSSVKNKKAAKIDVARKMLATL